MWQIIPERHAKIFADLLMPHVLSKLFKDSRTSDALEEKLPDIAL